MLEEIETVEPRQTDPRSLTPQAFDVLMAAATADEHGARRITISNPDQIAEHNTEIATDEEFAEFGLVEKPF